MSVKIESLKRQLPCSSVISQFIELMQAGRTLQGLCPFHEDDKTRSLTVYPSTQSWYCFGCGRGGDILNFLQERGKTFQEAIEWCELKVGKLPEPKFEPKFTPKKKQAHVGNDIINYWHSLLRDRRKYFKGRLLTDETIDNYKLGWTGQRYSIPFWEGVPGQSKVLAVQSRRDGQNGSKYIWELGTQPHLFGVRSLRENVSNKPTLVFFSTLDALLSVQDGFDAVGIPGQTVGTGSEHCWQELSSKAVDLLGFRDLIIVPDRGEEQKGYQLAHLLNCSLFEWPEGDYSDYCEFRLKNSAELFRGLING